MAVQLVAPGVGYNIFFLISLQECLQPPIKKDGQQREARDTHVDAPSSVFRGIVVVASGVLQMHAFYFFPAPTGRRLVA